MTSSESKSAISEMAFSVLFFVLGAVGVVHSLVARKEDMVWAALGIACLAMSKASHARYVQIRDEARR